MSRLQLIAHPAQAVPRVDSLEVVLTRSVDESLVAVFACSCPVGALLVPKARAAEAKDELWRHTCCELFLGSSRDTAYREFNFSPSGEWTSYVFSDYRIGDSSAMQVSAPRITFIFGDAGWRLEARLDKSSLPPFPVEQIILGVAVVLEARTGELSYWALQHGAAQPDFHRRDSFVLQLSDVE